MKVALAVAGQCRTDRGYRGIIDTIVYHTKADVYLATWNDSEAYRAFDVLNPVAVDLVPNDIFPSLKLDFWEKYKLLADPNILEIRRKFLNGEFISERLGHSVHRDNTFRMFYLNYRVFRMIPNRYDYIIKVRPDQKIKHPLVPDLLDPMDIACPIDHYGVSADPLKQWMSDQLFYGRPEPMKIAMEFWANLPEYAAEIEDPIFRSRSLSKSPPVGWLHPESSLRRYLQSRGVTIVPKDIQTGVYRWKGMDDTGTCPFRFSKKTEAVQLD